MPLTHCIPSNIPWNTHLVREAQMNPLGRSPSEGQHWKGLQNWTSATQWSRPGRGRKVSRVVHGNSRNAAFSWWKFWALADGTRTSISLKGRTMGFWTWQHHRNQGPKKFYQLGTLTRDLRFQVLLLEFPVSWGLVRQLYPKKIRDCHPWNGIPFATKILRNGRGSA
jgi:hypothetical protein